MAAARSAACVPAPCRRRLCVGLGEACAIAQREMGAEAERLTMLRDRFYNKIRAELPEVFLNGDPRPAHSSNLNISFAYVEGEGL